MRGAILALAALLVAAPAAPAAHLDKRVIVLGFDGLDHGIVARMMEEGRLPSFSRLAKQGTFEPLGTSIPPQSPVAWSNFITGLDSGGHGIFDFLHRKPETILPYLSTSEPPAAGKTFSLGECRFPLGGGDFVSLRYGTPFWEVLTEQGVETTIVRMPANFPVSGTATRELSGMGTPDVHGTYGTFSYYVTDMKPFAGEDIGGGEVYDVNVIDDRVEASLYGPNNPLVEERVKLEIPFTVYVDPDEPLATLAVAGTEHVLQVGEWSDWIQMQFDVKCAVAGIDLPVDQLPVIARFYLKEVRPDFKLYVTPLDHDPMKTKMPISHPPSFAKELAEAAGLFFTEGMPEDTRALDQGILDREEFLDQARIPGQEVVDQYYYVLDEYDEGLLFYYFGNQDQIAHMIWNTMDPEHPSYVAEEDEPFAHVVPEIIESLDEVVGYTLDRLGPDDTLVIMSDHGFASWRRAMNLNTWLWKEGYLALKNPNIQKDPGFWLNVDWSRTRAYGCGLNGLYVNQRGREKYGIVNESDKRALLEEIAARLVEVKDPETGLHAVTKAYIAEDSYHDRGHLDVGPDMVVGYAKQMRGSNQSAMGEIPPDVFIDNDEQWGADHCMDHETVPGVLFTNRPLKKPAPTLQSLGAAIVAEFGVEGFPGDAEKELRSVGYISPSNASN